MKKFFDNFKTAAWVAEFLWKVGTLLIITLGGTTAGFLASGLEIFRGFGWLAWYGVALIAALIFALIIYLARASQRAGAQALLASALAAKSTRINPLDASFEGQIIHIADLHLPGKQMHEHKQFRRCKFVGPGAIGLLGGSVIRCGFYDIGHILTLPNDTMVSGITILQNCTFEECQFYQITLIAPRNQAQSFAQLPGVQVAM
jgi:hypothetical protein